MPVALRERPRRYRVNPGIVVVSFASAQRTQSKQHVQGINSPAKLLAAKLKGAVGKPKPGFIEPSLATLWPKPPKGDGWVHEIKFDGYRFQLHLDAGTPVLHPPRRQGVGAPAASVPRRARIIPQTAGHTNANQTPSVSKGTTANSRLRVANASSRNDDPTN
jgi:hypothetical protein